MYFKMRLNPYLGYYFKIETHDHYYFNVYVAWVKHALKYLLIHPGYK